MQAMSLKAPGGIDKLNLIDIEPRPRDPSRSRWRLRPRHSISMITPWWWV